MRLYLRSRALPAALLVLIALTLLTWRCADWLVDSPRFGTTARVPVVALAPLLAGSAAAASLFTHSAELERTAPRPLAALRGVQLLLVTALYALALGATVTSDAAHFGAQAMVRNVLGTAGLAALSAVAFGARLAWVLPLACTGTAYLAAPRVHGGAVSVWAWPVQPGAEGGAWGAALGLLAAGVAAGVRWGPRAGSGRA
ncbi:hypothetical protein SRB5_38260 [Streptomyces sp. RB5]|uniref:Uncharacterized protein n=1 Tax=Streptomyces smaragdinus TaxID=2585196 RepID=A0A7K0CJQ7_9ACTN|nr:hypothetical protein [Streptomyces smaragdinus]MQY13676.1 hypothetical protein [Streptomyces smaragdinus]